MQKQTLNSLKDKLFLQDELVRDIKLECPILLEWFFAKKCKSFIAPGINSRIRLGRASVKSIRISCHLCGHTYRKIIPQ